jgi:hypothetical protein
MLNQASRFILLAWILQLNVSLATPGDENWSTNFSSPGGGEVYGMTKWHSNLVCVGRFLTAGGTTANKIAEWNGTAWAGLPTGSASFETLQSIATGDSKMYVAGVFNSIAGVPVSNLAQTDGTNWSAVGSGLNALILQAVTHVDGILYVAGFLTVNGTNTSIAAWDGSTWQPLGYSSGNVNAIYVNGQEIYAGGTFTSIGGITATNIARFDGTNWSALGGGLNGAVRCVTAQNGILYAGGDFTASGALVANHMAMWDGSAWTPMQAGLDARVRTLAIHEGALYAGGAFTGLLTRWDGTTWSSVAGLSGHFVESLLSSGNTLYVGGSFESANGEQVNNVAQYDAQGWHAMKAGVSGGMVNTLRVSGNALYAGGAFRTLAGTPANSIAKFDGTNWASIGDGIKIAEWSLPVYDVTALSNTVFAGGNFQSVDSAPLSDLFKWNGTNWAKDATSFSWNSSSSVNAMATLGTNVYAAGLFSPGNIARWNGQTWQSPPTPSFASDGINALCTLGTNLYIGGLFSSPYKNLYKWNGSASSSIGLPNGAVYSLAASGTNLFVGGHFSTVQTTACSNIAKWNGQTWTPLGSGVNGAVRAIATQGDVVIVGGDFTIAGGLPANHIAKWDGTNWYCLGSGIGGGEFPTVRALAIWQNQIFVGGNFSSVGGKESFALAAWIIQPPSLQSSSAGDPFALSWPADTKKFTLQKTDDLSSGAWADVPEVAILSNSVYTVQPPLSASQRFYRLRP